MAIKIEEGWLSSNGTILAARKSGGGYVYFINSKMEYNNLVMENHPVVAREISTLNLEIMEAKR